MILENKGKEFEVRYGGTALKIPSGQFEVETKCARHILKKVKGKALEVIVIEGPEKKATITKITDIKPIEVKEDIKEEVKKEADKKPATKKTTKK